MQQLLTDSITPYPQNNRIHPTAQVERIAASIKAFGFNQPIVVDETNTVLVGHGRLLAAQMLGLDKVPVQQVSNLTATQKRAYRILDNKLQNDSEWDYAMLEKEIAALELDNVDLQQWGLDKLKDLFGETVDPSAVAAEYSDMPSYETFNGRAKMRTVLVHFESDADVQAFAKLLEQPITAKTKSLWYPRKEKMNLENVAVVDEHKSA